MSETIAQSDIFAQLDNKVTKDANFIWYDVIFMNGYEGKLKFAKDSAGNVFLCGTARKLDAAPIASEEICTLPAGFRPFILKHSNVAAAHGTTGTSYATIIVIAENGSVQMTSSSRPSCYYINTHIVIDTVFKAAP